jgi:hypothetical protein
MDLTMQEAEILSQSSSSTVVAIVVGYAVLARCRVVETRRWAISHKHTTSTAMNQFGERFAESHTENNYY